MLIDTPLTIISLRRRGRGRLPPSSSMKICIKEGASVSLSVVLYGVWSVRYNTHNLANDRILIHLLIFWSELAPAETKRFKRPCAMKWTHFICPQPKNNPTICFTPAEKITILTLNTKAIRISHSGVNSQHFVASPVITTRGCKTNVPTTFFPEIIGAKYQKWYNFFPHTGNVALW